MQTSASVSDRNTIGRTRDIDQIFAASQKYDVTRRSRGVVGHVHPLPGQGRGKAVGCREGGDGVLFQGF